MDYNDLDDCLEEMLRSGAAKLPSVKEANWREDIYANCLTELGDKSYGENLRANTEFLEITGILKKLSPKLLEIAKSHFKLSVDEKDVYNVCRLVRPGDKSEGYRGHFDSHLFTLVTPIKIPNFGRIRDGGQLHYYPKARKQPNNELENILGKAYYKRYNSERGFEKLSKKRSRLLESFQDYRPLIFLGNTTFHGNAPVQSDSTENRMTILTHFFDPSPKYGIGAIMRRIRRR